MFVTPTTDAQKSQFLKAMGFQDASITAALKNPGQWNDFYNSALQQAERFYAQGPAKYLGQFANASNPDAINKPSNAQSATDLEVTKSKLQKELDPTTGSIPAWQKRFSALQSAGLLTTSDIDQFNSIVGQVGKILPNAGVSLLQGGSGKQTVSSQDLIDQVTGTKPTVGFAPPVDQTKVATTPTTPKLNSIAQNIADQLKSGMSASGQPLVGGQFDSLKKQFASAAGFEYSGPIGGATSNTGVATSATPSNLNDIKTADQFDQWANTLQDGLHTSTMAPPVKGVNAPSTSDTYLTDIVSGKIKPPDTLNTEDALSKLRTQYGIDPLEQQISTLDAQAKQIQDTMRANQYDETGKPVSLGVMAGRLSEEEKQANMRLDEINTQKATLVNQLNQKYNVVNGIMAAKKTDYENAVQAYDSQYNKAIQMTTLLRGVQNDNANAAEKIKDDARANFTIVANNITSGAMDWDSIPPAQKIEYQKLELQAGLPSGTLEAFTKKPSKDWAMQTVLPGVDSNGNAIATILEKNNVTGEFKTTKLVTDYAPKSSANAGQKGTFVDDNNNEVAWQLDASGNMTKTIIGKSKIAPSSDPDLKAQNDFEKFRANLIMGMGKTNVYGDPLMTYDQAAAALKAQYPTLSPEAVKFYLTGTK